MAWSCAGPTAFPRPHYTYVMVLTSNDSKPNYLEAIEAGTDDFLGKPLQEELLAARLHVAQRIGGLLSEMQQLQSLLPICPSCKKICAENGAWIDVESYLAGHLSPGITRRDCPGCEQRLRTRLGHLNQELRKRT